MRRRLSILTIVAMVLSLLAYPVQAEAPQTADWGTTGLATIHREMGEAVSLPASLAEKPQAWFVELSAPPASPLSISAMGRVQQQQDAFLAAAADAGLQVEERFRFDRLWNGLSIAANEADLERIAALPGVKAIYPVLEVERPDVQFAEPAMATALSMTGADVVQSELGYTGAGITVAVIDTGIDYMHADLGGGFGPGYKVRLGWDFVGDDYNADPSSPGYNPVPVPDDDPMDCNGHGTHVAGIVAANGNVVGVAPGASLGAYRVFGCDGSTSSDIILAALEQAHADGVDIVNMSLGSAYQWPQYPTSVAASRLVDEGIVVVASIGNSGQTGIFSASAPGVGDKVIGVASFENTHSRLPGFSVDGIDGLIGYNTATHAPLPPVEGSLPMSVAEPLEACSELSNDTDVAGTAVLIQRGSCTFYEKALAAQQAGAAAVVLYNNVAGRINPTVEGETEITIPVVSITLDDGSEIKALIEGADPGAVMLTWTAEYLVSETPKPGLIADTSSWGLANDLTLKPDLGAPGGQIFSTYPRHHGNYATISGTSMAAPHVAGAVALMLEADPTLKLKANTPKVRDLLQNTAEPQPWTGNPGLGFLDAAHRQGAGLIRIDHAILSKTSVAPAKLSLGDNSQGRLKTATLTLTNNSDKDIVYNLSNTPAVSTLGVYDPLPYILPMDVTFKNAQGAVITQVAVPRNSTVAITVEIAVARDEAVDGLIYGGYLVFDPGAAGHTLRVPYAGIDGSYQRLSAMNPIGLDLPWLTFLREGPTGPSYVRIADNGYTFGLRDEWDEPNVIFHLDYPASEVRLDVLNPNSGNIIGTADVIPFMGRNSAQGTIHALTWDGTVLDGDGRRALGPGHYQLKLSVLKPNGNPGNPAHWETWVSPSFFITDGPVLRGMEPSGVVIAQPGDTIAVSFRSDSGLALAAFRAILDLGLMTESDGLVEQQANPGAPLLPGEIRMTESGEEPGLYTGQWTVPFGVGGLARIQFRAADLFGRETTAMAPGIIYFAPPTTVPTITAPANGAYLNDSDVVFKGGAPPLDLVDLMSVVSDDTVMWWAAGIEAGPDGFWQTTIELPDGTWTFHAVLRDVHGTETLSDPVTFTVDTTAPEIAISDPADGAVLTEEGLLEVTGTVSDDNLADVSVNGVAATVSDDGTFVAYVEIVAGENVITATATDLAGHSATDSVTVTVELPDPGNGDDEPGDPDCDEDPTADGCAGGGEEPGDPDCDEDPTADGCAGGGEEPGDPDCDEDPTADGCAGGDGGDGGDGGNGGGNGGDGGNGGGIDPPGPGAGPGALLESLSISGVKLNFDPEVTEYTVTLRGLFRIVRIRATAADPDATIRIGDVEGTGSLSLLKVLFLGSNTVKVNVTVNGETTTYTFNIRLRLR